MYREVVLACRVLDTISRDFFRIPWNHSNWQNDRCHFECFVCFGKTSKMYREVVLACRVLDTMARLSPLHHSNWQNDRCHFECFVCFEKTSEIYREVRWVKSSSRYDFMGFLSNPMKSLELTKCCINVTSSLPAFLGRQVIFDRKLYREVRQTFFLILKQISIS